MTRVTLAEVTGELPLAAFGIGMASSYEDELDWQELKFMASGCLDAPLLIPAGGIRIGFEEMQVCRTIDRNGL